MSFRALFRAASVAAALMPAASAFAQEEASARNEASATLGASEGSERIETSDDSFEAALGEARNAPTLSARATTRVGVLPLDASASSDVEIDPVPFRAVPRRTSEQLLTLAPGFVLTNHSGIGHAASIYLRGFDAGEGQDVSFDVDGVLLNEHSNPHGHGYADTSFIPVEVVRRVLVKQGPFDPRQPSYSVAGSVRYDLGVAERGLHSSLRYGSFRTVRGLAVFAPRGEREGTFVAADMIRGDGFGPNRAHQSARLVGRYERVVRDLTFSLLAASHAQRFDSAGVLPDASYRAETLPCAPNRDEQFYCVADPNQGGSAQRHLILGRVAIDRGRMSYEQLVYAMARDDRFRDNFTGIALNPLGDGLDQDYRAATIGMRGSARGVQNFLGAEQRFEFGYLGRYDRGRTSMSRLRLADGTPRANVFDSSFQITEIALYGLANLELGRFVSFQGGARLEAMGVSMRRHGLGTSDRDGPRLSSSVADGFGFAFSPRATLSLHAHRSLDIVLAAGAGTRPADLISSSDREPIPFTRVGSYELGLRHRIESENLRINSRASAYATRVADELVFDPEAGRNLSIGETRRFGATLHSELHFRELFSAQGSFSWSEAHRAPPGTSFFDLGSGPRVAFVPRFVGRLDAAYHGSIKLRSEELRVSLGAGLGVIGRKPMPFEQLSSRIAVVDAGVELRYRVVGVELLVENLLDSRYRNFEFMSLADFSPYDGSAGGSMRPTRMYAAGAPRTFFISLAFHPRTIRDSSDSR